MANETKTDALTVINQSKEDFSALMEKVSDFNVASNAVAAFDAADLVIRFEKLLSNEVMEKVFMPLMNKKIGFKTDKDPAKKDKNGATPTPYSVEIVRSCIIDGILNGLMPTGNQMNIIAGNMYPTKEGYTALLNKLKKGDMHLVYSFEFDPEVKATSADPSYVAIPCRIGYKTSREDMKGWFKYVALVKSNGATSTSDQLRGKAERKCKKAFYEFLTGIDLGDGDADTVDTTYVEVKEEKSTAQKAREVAARVRARNEQKEVEAALDRAEAKHNELTEEEKRQAEEDLIREEQEGR